MCRSSALATLTAALVMYLLVICLTIGAAAGPWASPSNGINFYLTYSEIAVGHVVVQYSGEWSTFGTIALGMYIFATLCYIICFVAGVIRVCLMMKNNDETVRASAPLYFSAVPSIIFSVFGLLFIVMPFYPAILVAYHFDSAWGTGLISGIFTIPFAIIALACEASSSCCYNSSHCCFNRACGKHDIDRYTDDVDSESLLLR
jgi:hypothetical protein